MKTEITEQERKAIEAYAREIMKSGCVSNERDFLDGLFKGVNFALSELRKPSEPWPPKQEGSTYAAISTTDKSLGKPSENTDKLVIVEAFADNGEHSHWYLIDSKTGATIWEEPETIGRTDEELEKEIKQILLGESIIQKVEFKGDFFKMNIVREWDFEKVSTEIVKLLPSSRSQENVNKELLDAAKYFRAAWNCEWSKLTAKCDDVNKHNLSIENAEKQINHETN